MSEQIELYLATPVASARSGQYAPLGWGRALTADLTMETFKTGTLPLYLTTEEVAQLLRLARGTLAKHRVYGTGPAYRKIGGRVIYLAADLFAWAETGARDSTSDARTGPSPAKRHFAVPR